MKTLHQIVIAAAIGSVLIVPGFAADVVVRIDQPMAPPEWALLQRTLLDTNARACREFFQKYFDERGFLLCVERWGGDDGPDDAIENCNDWPLLHMLGANDDVKRMTNKAWEGHLRQFTLARTTHVPFAKDGMYYKEFPVKFDWLHNGEGLTVFDLMGLSAPYHPENRKRIRRYAGFYLNEDPGAPNYDPEHKIIRSLFNGSRGPLLRKATGLDWAGDPIEVENRFHLGHGERSYAEMIAHFKDYNDVVGDHPSNLAATSLALLAYMLDHNPKYKKWLLEYVDAWCKRAEENQGILPSNIGLDGKIGSAADGKWYGGVYGWGFTVEVPQTGAMANRNTVALGIVGFGNAYLLTGDDKYLSVWRNMIAKINSNSKTVDGVKMYPRMFGDQGWYGYTTTPYNSGEMELWYWSMNEQDTRKVASHPWLKFLAGENPGYPTEALKGDLAQVRSRVLGMRQDSTTPDTRLSDDPMRFNPASVGSLLNLMLGGIHPGRRGAVLHSRLRYFDDQKRRAGVPDDVAALVTSLTKDEVSVTLVNTDALRSRRLIVQSGAYGEHQFQDVTVGDKTLPVNDKVVKVVLGPGAGGVLRFRTNRYVNQPTMNHPW